jgi:hypothetical protein
MTSLIGKIRRSNPPSLYGYYWIQVISWVYSILWISSLAATWIYWDSLGILAKASISLVLIILTPSVSDLFEPYSKYVDRWKELHPDKLGSREEDS